MTQDKRRFTRIPFKVTAHLQMQDPPSPTVDTVLNLGIGGCRLAVTPAPAVGRRCRVEIVLAGSGNPAVTIRAEGTIVRQEVDAVAVEFTQIDPDSLFHLQNVVRYNAEDADLVDAEIRKRPGIL